MSIFHIIRSKYSTALGIVLYTVSTLSTARAETINCTAITSLPYVITSQGIYCFTGHLSTSITSGHAIEIQTNNVTIDMNGFKLGGLGAGDSTQANGIYANQRKNITIRNGVIRGFYRGIILTDSSPYTTSQGHAISEVLVDQSTYIGILAYGRGMTIRRNQVVDTGGSTIAFDGYGIFLRGPGNNIIDNQVITTTATSTGNAYGAFLGQAGNSMVKENRMSEVVASGTGISYGINITGSNDVMVRDNILTSADNGIFYTGGSTGLYGDNYTSGITTPFTSGTAAGTTNYSNP